MQLPFIIFLSTMMVKETTKKTSVASWGEYRIPCSGDFDGGDGDFSPNPKYWQYGWEEFRY